MPYSLSWKENGQMRIILLCFLAFAFVVPFTGCGGGSGSPADATFTIRNFGFEPHTVTVKVGTTVTWVNADIQTHTIASGTLGSINSPRVFSVNLLDNGFTPVELNIILGDTVRFFNQSNFTRQIEVKDPVSLNVVFLSPMMPPGTAVDVRLGSAGEFSVRVSDNPNARMVLTVVGIPNPDNRFPSSGTLTPGQKFSVTFNTSGNFPFFCSTHNIENGVVNVQP
jgi:plastocyanin